MPTDVTFFGNGSIYATAAFYQRFAASVGSESGLTFHLKRGAAGLAAFEAEVKRVAGNDAQVQAGEDANVEAVGAQRETSLQALALVLFAVIVALAMLVIVAQSIARQAYTASDDFPVLRALGISHRNCSRFRWPQEHWSRRPGWCWRSRSPTGCRRSRRSGWHAGRRSPPDSLSTPRSCWAGRPPLRCCWLAGQRSRRCVWCGSAPACPRQRPGARGSPIARWMAGRGFPPTAVSGVRLGRAGPRPHGCPVRSAILGMAVALAAVMASLVFGSSLAHVIDDPVIAGWNWDVAVGNPHSGDISAQTEPRLRKDPDVAGFTATAMSDGLLLGRPATITIVGMQPVTGEGEAPVLTGLLRRAPGEIALGGRELRALHKRIGDHITARGARGPVALHIVGQVVLSPEITNEQVQLGGGGVMTMAGANALSKGAIAPQHVPRRAARGPPIRRPSRA